MQKDEIGGSALKNGLLYEGQHYKVTGINTKSGVEFKVEELKPLIKPAVNLPIIRGIIVGWPFPLIFYLFFIMSYSQRIIIILIAILYTLLTFNKSTREYHGAEHKVVNAFLNEQDITELAILRRSSMICRRCGSTFLILVAIISVFMAILVLVTPVPVWLAALLVSGIAYELHTAHKDSWIVKQIVSAALAIQGKCVAKPSDEKLMLASQTLITLLEKEQETEFQKECATIMPEIKKKSLDS